MAAKPKSKASVTSSGRARKRAQWDEVLRKLSMRMSPEAVEAMKAIQAAKAGAKAARTPRRLQGKKAAAIRRAVRSYYLG